MNRAAPLETAAGRHWVFHRGALGDSVLLWPMLRAWRAGGVEVTLITDRSKGALAAQELGIQFQDAESPRFNQLWVPESPVEPIPDVRAVTAFIAPESEGGNIWLDNATRLFPSAAIRLSPERPTRALAKPFPLPPAVLNPGAPILLHIGAGSEQKRWPLTSWIQLARSLGQTGTAQLIAGEVEHERLTMSELSTFRSQGGEFLWKLDELAAVLKKARMFISADCGPAHLAAQLGIPTFTLFGPTNPDEWAPVGPTVRALAPETPRAMDWLAPHAAAQEITTWSGLVFGGRE